MRYNIYYEYSNGDSCFQKSFDSLRSAMRAYNKEYTGKILNDNNVCLRRFKGTKFLGY